MTTPERQKARGTLILAAKEIGEKLELALRDPQAQSVSLTRTEASLVVGLITGAAEALAHENSALNDVRPLPDTSPE